MDANEYVGKLKLLTGLSMLLQSCDEEKELFEVSYWYFPQLFPNTPGKIFIVNETSKKLEPVYSWPSQDTTGGTPDTSTCMAFLKGMAVDAVDKIPSECKGCSLGAYCLPFRVEGDSFGVFCLERQKDGLLPFPHKGLAFITTEYLSLAISNIRLKKRLREMAIRDSLTGLYNRRYMDDVTVREIKRAKRSGVKLGMITIDLDYFKHFNDTYGHYAGDEILREIAAVIKSKIRFEDMACRFGGEEFFILISTGTYENFMQKAADLIASIKSTEIFWQGQEIGPVTASAGVAVFPDHGQTLDDILKISDQALYVAKKRGRNQVISASELIKIQVDQKKTEQIIESYSDEKLNPGT